MAHITCPSCKTELTEYVRFCPECGARLPEPGSETTPDSPTLLMGSAKPAEEPPAEKPAAPATVRLDAPVAPTIMLPPADEPPPPATPASTPTARLDAPPPPTVMLPPADEPPPPEANSAPTMMMPGPGAPAASTPPPMTPPAPPPAYGAQLPTGAPHPGEPAPPFGQLPTGTPFPGDAPPAAPPKRRTLWWIIGGAGCLGLVVVAACAVIGVLTLLGSQVSEVFTEVEATAQSQPAGGGGIVPGDSPLAGGDVLFRDDFDSALASGLGEEEDASSRYAYEDGAYVIEVKEPETIVWAGVDGSYDDARVTVETEVPAGTDVSVAGLIFHYQDQDNFYLFSVSNDGYYALELLENNEWVTLIDWTISDAVDATRNTMRVETQGDRIALYVNDELLEETSDGTFTGGEVALAVSSLEDSTALVRFDNLLIEQN